MDTSIDETAPNVFRLSTWVPDIWYDEETRTLLSGDLFTHIGNPPALVDTDLVEPAVVAEQTFHATGLTPSLVPTLHQLAELKPTTLAVMRGSSFSGDGAAQLRGLADEYATMLA
jgi:flavorubredoxin